jgi:chorismate synthase
MLRFYTAGESHGQALLAFISGLPAQMPVDLKFINHELRRRQLGYGRGGRQKIEKDTVDIFAGVRHGKTIGAPIALRIENRDWANWEKFLPVEATGDDSAERKLVAPRPGHADLAGSQKFDYHDARYILERASARETAPTGIRHGDREPHDSGGPRSARKTSFLEENSRRERGPGFSSALY